MRVRLIALSLILLAACGGETKIATSDQPEVTTTVTEPVDSGDDANGRHVAKITAFDRAERRVTYDVVQLLSGEEARAAFQEDEGESLETDYYIRNQNTRLRTAAIADDAVFRVNTLGGNGSTDKEVDYETFAGYFAGEQALQTYFVIALRDEKAVAINEVYLP